METRNSSAEEESLLYGDDELLHGGSPGGVADGIPGTSMNFTSDEEALLLNSTAPSPQSPTEKESDFEKSVNTANGGFAADNVFADEPGIADQYEAHEPFENPTINASHYDADRSDNDYVDLDAGDELLEFDADYADSVTDNRTGTCELDAGRDRGSGYADESRIEKPLASRTNKSQKRKDDNILEVTKRARDGDEESNARKRLKPVITSPTDHGLASGEPPSAVSNFSIQKPILTQSKVTCKPITLRRPIIWSAPDSRAKSKPASVSSDEQPRDKPSAVTTTKTSTDSLSTPPLSKSGLKKHRKRLRLEEQHRNEELEKRSAPLVIKNHVANVDLNNWSSSSGISSSFTLNRSANQPSTSSYTAKAPEQQCATAILGLRSKTIHINPNFRGRVQADPNIVLAWNQTTPSTAAAVLSAALNGPAASSFVHGSTMPVSVPSVSYNRVPLNYSVIPSSGRSSHPSCLPLPNNTPLLPAAGSDWVSRPSVNQLFGAAPSMSFGLNDSLLQTRMLTPQQLMPLPLFAQQQQFVHNNNSSSGMHPVTSCPPAAVSMQNMFMQQNRNMFVNTSLPVFPFAGAPTAFTAGIQQQPPVVYNNGSANFVAPVVSLNNFLSNRMALRVFTQQAPPMMLPVGNRSQLLLNNGFVMPAANSVNVLNNNNMHRLTGGLFHQPFTGFR